VVNAAMMMLVLSIMSWINGGQDYGVDAKNAESGMISDNITRGSLRLYHIH
jgi:hypothetical protein